MVANAQSNNGMQQTRIQQAFYPLRLVRAADAGRSVAVIACEFALKCEI